MTNSRRPVEHDDDRRGGFVNPPLPRNAAIRYWEWGVLALILALAASLRLGAPGITEFKRDEGNMARLALDTAHRRDLPLLGLSSSVNVPNPPISVYLLAVPFVFSDSPIPATLFVGVLNVIAVGLTWGLARRYYGPLAAITAGLLYAASPWAVIYSRKIWAQDLLPPFVVMTVFAGLLGYGEGKRWARWAHWPLLAITVQIHYGAFTLIPISLLMLALWLQIGRGVLRYAPTERRQPHPYHSPSPLVERGPGGEVRRRSELVIIIGIAALTALPALIGAYQGGWLSLDTLRDGLNQDTDHERVISTTAVDYAWFTVAGTDIHSLAGPEQFRRYLDSVPDVYPLFKLVPLGAALAAGWLLWQTVRRRQIRQSPNGVLIAWLITPVLAFTWAWTEVAPHYMIPLMPAAYVLCGAGLEGVRELYLTPQPPLRKQRGGVGARLARAVLAGGVILALIIAGFQIFLFAELLHFLDTHNTPDGFGTPLHYLMDARAAVLDQRPDSVIVISEEELAPYDEIPAVWGALLDSVPDARFVNGAQTAVIPSGKTWELIAWSPALRTCEELACQDQPGTQVFERRPGEPPYLLRPAQAPAWAVDPTEIEPVRFANGAYLTGYTLRDNAVILFWRLGGRVAEDYQAFVHALDTNGQKVAQQDRLSWPGRYWRAGDTLALWFDLALPTDTAALYIGMYTLVDSTYRSVEVLDAQGAYVAQGATISLNLAP